jgi:protein-disulfide isomerase
MGVLVMLTLLAGVWQLRSKDPEPTPATGDATGAQDALLDARTVGDPSAPVTVYEVSDFQCPYCRQFWELTLPALKEEYIATGQIRLIFINLPLASIHPNAPAAHEFAMCSARQGLFWPVHDLLFQTQADWKGLDDLAPFFMSLADSAGVDRNVLTQCLTTGAMRPVVRADLMMASQGGINSTPTFVIEGAALRGAAPIEQWRLVLDSIIAEKTGN